MKGGAPRGADVDLYFQQVVEPGLTARPSAEGKGQFLSHELEKWERTEAILHEWALRDDESPNPFTPELDPELVTSTIGKLSDCLDRLFEREASAPQLVAAE